MNILLVQDHLRTGGAARAAGRWADLLRREGHRVIQAAGDEPGPDAVQLTGKPPRGIGRLLELWGGRQKFRQERLQANLARLLEGDSWDLVWFHNLAGGQKWGWSEEMVVRARARIPVLWTLHDMWALGDSSESYWEEDQMVEGGRWKGAMVEGLKGLGVEELRRSRVEKVCRAEAKFPIMLTAPSRWLVELTTRITGQTCRQLPNPIDLKTFSPGERAVARRALGLPSTGQLVLGGADSLNDSRKGMDLLARAWKEVNLPEVRLVLFGRGKTEIPGAISLGSLQEDRAMADAYRAADLYVHPARMENAPCTIQESLACGTPVLAFGVGGIPEMILPGQNGFLVAEVAASALADALQKTFNDIKGLEAMRRGCRESAQKDYTPDIMLEKFHRLRTGMGQS